MGGPDPHSSMLQAPAAHSRQLAPLYSEVCAFYGISVLVLGSDLSAKAQPQGLALGLLRGYRRGKEKTGVTHRQMEGGRGQAPGLMGVAL